MILLIDLQNGEVRDPAVGVVGQVTWREELVTLDNEHLGTLKVTIEIPHERVLAYVKRMEGSVTF